MEVKQRIIVRNLQMFQTSVSVIVNEKMSNDYKNYHNGRTRIQRSLGVRDRDRRGSSTHDCVHVLERV